MKKTVTIYITKNGWPRRERIKQFFGIEGISVNGEARVTITDDITWNILQQTAARGFVEIREK